MLQWVSKVYLAKENIIARGLAEAWGVVCSVLITAQQWLPNLFPQQPNLIFGFCLTSLPSTRVCAHMLLGPPAGLGDGEVGNVWRTQLMPGSSRAQEKNWAICLVFATNFLSPLRESSFYLGNPKMDLMLSLSFLLCFHLLLWTVNKTEIYMCYTLYPYAQVFLQMSCWESQGRALRYVGSLEGPCRAKPTPGHLSEPSSRSQFHISFSSPFREASGLLELGREVLRGLRNPLFCIGERVLLKPGFTTRDREKCPVLREQVPLAEDVGNQQWCLPWDCVP